MRLTQRLCPNGRKLRNEFRNMDADMPLLDRERITKAYFWHKRKCASCDLRWYAEGDDFTQA